jgi:hypothetical protein
MGIFKSSICRAFCCTLCVIIVLLIIAFGITAGVLAATFKQPDIQVSNVRLSPNQDTTTSVQSRGHLEMQLLIDIIAKNPNSFDIFLSQAVITSMVKDDKGGRTALGVGSIKNQNIKGKGETTAFTFPINIKWQGNRDPSNAAIRTLLNTCSVGQTATGGVVPTDHALDLWVKIWSIGPIRVPTITRSQDTPCPDSASTLLNQSASNQAPLSRK